VAEPAWASAVPDGEDIVLRIDPALAPQLIPPLLWLDAVLVGTRRERYRAYRLRYRKARDVREDFFPPEPADPEVAELVRGRQAMLVERASGAVRRVVGDLRRGGDVRLDRRGVREWLGAMSHLQLALLPRRGVDVVAEVASDPWLLPVVVVHCVQYVLVAVDGPEGSRRVHGEA
jgi:hypothetical protein